MAGATHVRTLILGAGFGGLGMGAQLVRAGDEDFVILERAGDIGGVWRENAYPGAACDTEAHLYCYSFFPHLRVSRMYAGREELLGYMGRLAEEYGLRDHIRFDSEILSAEWDGAARLWRFAVRGGARYTAEVFVTAWGQLNKPAIPAFEGLESFRGETFHSAEWDGNVPLAGRRVASVGNAASAVQYVPEIAPEVGQLTVFQRTANWIMPRNQIVFDPAQLDAYEADPALFDASRAHLHAFRENGFSRTQVGSEAQAEGIRLAQEHLEKQVADPDLRAKLTPDYEFGCKRILRSDDFFPALCRENVALETRRIARFTEDGIETADGTVLPFDVVIFGTGFASQAFHGDLIVKGEDGASLSDVWADGAEAYLGMTVPGFPNMFMIYGPNTNLNHNSIITMLEIQQDYVLRAIRETEARGAAAAVHAEVFDRFNERMQADMASSAFSSGCSSWYKNAAGKVINNWSGTVDQYRRAAEWNADDYAWR
ncbi:MULTISPECIES: flavin-containing monooxygenase [unclassified Haematobacter]|uniref:flavin-containing monooxygenase n=1 Tax=unclassified Haematobacter TaxID=2640585 RepID=UPI0025BE0664|nr:MULTISPECIES: NAD(P)/FAD-dependent oxidoreductase [unclassified Haematobacter]